MESEPELCARTSAAPRKTPGPELLHAGDGFSGRRSRDTHLAAAAAAASFF